MAMGSTRRGSRLFGLVLALAGAAAGCGSKATSASGALSFTDADFSVCSGTPAIRFTPGLSVASTSGAYRVAIESAVTDRGAGAAQVATAAIGYATFTMAVTSTAGSGGDAGTPAPDGLTMTTPAVPGSVPADPYMPQHGHGASTVPAITAQGGGLFTVAAVDFFMGGYWQLYLDLIPSTGVADPVTFDICVPTD
jgi:hypothetical protein